MKKFIIISFTILLIIIILPYKLNSLVTCTCTCETLEIITFEVSPDLITPNGNGTDDETTITVDLSNGDAAWEVKVNGTVIGSGTGSGSCNWDGQISGSLVSEGIKTLNLTATRTFDCPEHGSQTLTKTTSAEVEIKYKPTIQITAPTEQYIPINTTKTFEATASNADGNDISANIDWEDAFITSNTASTAQSFSITGDKTVTAKVQDGSYVSSTNKTYTAVKVDKIQYSEDGSSWSDFPGTLNWPKDKTLYLKAIKDPSTANWPSGKPVWGGEASGTDEQTTVDFSSTGSQTVTAECGNTKTGNVTVFKVEIIESSIEVGQAPYTANTFITNTETTCRMHAQGRVNGITGYNNQMDWVLTPPTGVADVNADDREEVDETPTINGHGGGRGGALSITFNTSVDISGVISNATPITWTQDEIDQIRQEYVDHNITIPARGDFSNSGGSTNFTFAELNWGDYSYAIITADLTTGLENTRSNLGNQAMIVNSGYRNPQHNESVGGVNNSQHQYGVAADIDVRDFNGDGLVNDNDVYDMVDSAWVKDDWLVLATAARDAGASFVEPYSITGTWVHMDWR